jgi:membrane-bound lytic murein transglycosylase D
VLATTFALVLSWHAAPARAAAERIPFPPELQEEVNFWIRVYTEIGTSGGFLHDQNDLAIVYRTLQFESDVQPGARRDAIDAEREKIEKMLRRLAAGATDLSEDETRLKAAFGDKGTAARFTEAAKNVRFQLGQSDRFREGLERSTRWQSHIAQTFANLGLPPELAALPHVESSFNPDAYSKVGAAGLWQFMRSTGRRYLRIDDAVDERMDPFRATEAAAQLLDYNYRFLDSWPLALTAYNHGSAGMRRAADSQGTTDIVKIIRDYRSPSFGFASRNFYVSFLAALTIDRNPDKYFSNLKRQPEVAFTEVELPAFVPLAVLEKTFKVERSKLAALNPAFRAALLNGSRYVPRGYRLRLPPDQSGWTTSRIAQLVPLTDQYLNQPRERSHRVRKGDTLATVAKRYGMNGRTLARLNGLEDGAALRVGRTLRLPEVAATRVAAVQAAEQAGEPGAAVAATAAPPATVAAAPAAATPAATKPVPTPAQTAKVNETLAEQRAEAAATSERKPTPEAVTAAEAEEESPSLVPGGAVARASESIDYSVGTDDTIRVAAEETIGHYADWLGLSASRLRALNKMAASSSVVLGRKLKLDFAKVSRAVFEGRRQAYHEQLQASFFANHRIAGTQVYVTRRGDSLWNVAQRNGQLPMWLVLHYNPDVDFNALRAGLEIVLPKVEQQPAG